MNESILYIGVARILQRGGSHCVKVRVLTRLSCRFKKKFKNGLFNYGHDIVMAFSPPVVGCLVKKRLAKRGGHALALTGPTQLV